MGENQQSPLRCQNKSTRDWTVNVNVLIGALHVRLLRVESRDFSQAEKKRTAGKAEQIHKMTTIFTQIIVVRCHFVNLLSFTSTYIFLSLRKIT